MSFWNNIRPSFFRGGKGKLFFNMALLSGGALATVFSIAMLGGMGAGEAASHTFNVAGGFIKEGLSGYPEALETLRPETAVA